MQRVIWWIDLYFLQLLEATIKLHAACQADRPQSGDVASSATEQGHDTAAPFVESVIIKPSQTEEEKLALQTEWSQSQRTNLGRHDV